MIRVTDGSCVAQTLNPRDETATRHVRNESKEGAMSKHTPGPWSACHEGACECGFIWDASEEVHVASVHDVTALGQSWYGSDIAVTAEEREANARLISAAPDLLVALVWAQKQLRMLVTDDDGDGAFIRGGGIELAGFGAGMSVIKAAIAKAGGV